MNTETSPVSRRVAWGAVLLAGVLSGTALAQSGRAGEAPAMGQGPGYHSPQSPIAPLKEREGVVSWSVLSAVTTKVEKNRVVPTFPVPVQALNNQKVKVQGFMMPLGPGEKQSHFLLSSVPTSCSFCIPAGPEGLVEVRATTPVRYSLEPVVMEGKLAVLTHDPYGIYYRLVEGEPAR